MRNLKLTVIFELIILTLFFLGNNSFAQDEVIKGVGHFSKTVVPYTTNGIVNPVKGNSTATITGLDVYTDIHFTNPADGNTVHVYAGTFKGTIDGQATDFYCIDLQHHLAFNEDYEDNGNTSSPITYILNNYYPYHTRSDQLSSTSHEAAAVQAAIWHYSDNIDVSTIDRADVKARAQAIIADADTSSGNTQTPSTLVITPATQNLTFGATADFTVTVKDINGDPVPNVTVNLSTTDGTLNTNSVTTDNNGEATFSLTQGNASTAVVTATATTTIPFGTKYTHKAAPNDKQKLVLATPVQSTATATASATWMPPSQLKIGDYVWHDSNVDGIQDANEDGIQGVVVNLYDASDNLLATTTTDQNGLYEFDNLSNGTYKVKLDDSNFQNGGVLYSTASTKWYATLVDQGSDDAKDNDAGSSHEVTVTLNNNDDMTIDFGFFKTCISLEKTGPASVNVGDDITYHFTVKNCGDLVLHGGAHVYDAMLNPNGNHEIWSGVLQPGQTANFDKTYTTTSNDCGNLVNNASAVGHPKMPDGSYKPNVTDEASHTVNVVCTQKGSIGDKVWYDDNENGIQDAGENGVANVDVKLFDCSGNLINATQTDNNGNYLFSDVPAGNYKVEFVLPSGYVFTTKDAGNDDAVDSDVDNNGLTDCFTLAAGQDDMTWDAGIHVPLSADLSLTKTVDNATPNDGDVVNFTITVKNDGPHSATGLEVTDVLPTGLDFNSATASQGSYDHNTGIWTVGTLAANATATLQIATKVNVTNCISSAFDLGPAKGYNLFVWRDFHATSSDIEGKAAVGRDAYFSNYSIADKIPDSTGVDVLVVGRDLYFNSGRVYYGNAVYKHSTNLPKSNVSVDGDLRHDHVINFNAARAYLRNLSSTLAGYTVNGNTTYKWDGVFLEGNDPYLNVFKVKGSELTASTYMDIRVPNGSVVLVNVDGKTINWNGGLTVTGTDITNVLYNFYKAKTLKIQEIDVRGSILAPRAIVNFSDGLISGQLIAKSMKGNGQLNNYPFIGNVPCNTQIENIAEITASDLSDPDSTPGNGEETEDDYASATITIGSQSGSGSGSGSSSGSGSGSGSSGSWNVASSFPINEIVWCITTDNSGNMIAGTMGGHIYFSDDNGSNWSVINSSMTTVGFIWALDVDNNGVIYAGTERGIFYSADNGSTWNGPMMSGYDVRAFLIASNGTMYAGTWGGGVFKSTDDGANWDAINDGLSPLGTAVQSLAEDTNGDLYAGTFGGGVYKSTDGSTWTMLNVGYPFVWAVATDSHNNIYAATYGAGVYRSTDAGATWSEFNNGLDAAYVYSVTVDNCDNVFVSTWLGDVYKFSPVVPSASSDVGDAGMAWTPMGLAQVGISSLVINPTNGQLFAGSTSGKIYVNTSAVTEVKNEIDIPKEFSLSQNYPNPFNPTTMIKVGIPKDGEYSLNVYNVLGQKVATLLSGQTTAGYHEVSFNASNLASGIYIYRLSGKNVMITKKMILMK